MFCSLIETVNQLAASIIDKLPVLMQNKNLNPFLAPNISQYIMVRKYLIQLSKYLCNINKS